MGQWLRQVWVRVLTDSASGQLCASGQFEQCL